MKKITLLLCMLTAGFYSQAQSTIFEDSFESYTDFAISGVGNWTLTDVDGGATGNVGTTVYPNGAVPQAFQVFNSTTTVPVLTSSPTGNWSARTGIKNMVCKYKSSAPRVNDDWMISPIVTLGTSNTVSFWAKACSGVAIETSEKFNVWISNTTTAIPSFIKISAGEFVVTEAPGITWREYTYSIPATYNNSSVYLGVHCISEDQYGFAVDDFKVTGTVACAAPQAGTSVVNTTALTAALSWTAGGAFNSEVKVQLAGAGVPATTNDTGVNVSATTYTTMPLLVNTNYEFWVRDECTDGTLFSSWSGPFAFNTNSVPNCATLVAPANAATAVLSTAPVTLSWTAATTGATATSYDLFFGTAVVPVTLAGNFTTLTTTRPVAALTTYYWKVVAKNAAGSAVGCTEVFSFTTAPNAFSPYCGPVTFTNVLEPITYVNFAGIDKTYSNATVPVVTAVHHKIFTDIATVAQGSTNVMSLKGMTDGGFTNRFIVYIDWNQNGVLNDSGEVYFETPELTINGSTGLPAVAPVTGDILVPATALLGNTRMRIKKIFGGVSAGSLPCTGAAFGEIHDYNVTVTLPNVATNTFSSTNFKFGPNPVKNVLEMSYDKNITNISVINLLGQEVLVSKANATNATIDLSSLTAGAYMVKVSADNEVKSIKVIKE